MPLSCRKCFTTLHKCASCRGGSIRGFLGARLTCSACNNTGLVCARHKGFWK